MHGLTTWSCSSFSFLIVKTLSYTALYLLPDRYNNHQFQNYLQMHYIFTDVVTSQKDGIGMSGYQLSQSWAKVPKVYAANDQDDPCCVPVLTTHQANKRASQPAGAAAAEWGISETPMVPRVAVRALSGGFCATLTDSAKAMIDSAQVPVIKGRAKRGPQGMACSGILHEDSGAAPPGGSILEYLLESIGSGVS